MGEDQYFEEFKSELKSLEKAPLPITKSKIRDITMIAILSMKKLKHVVQSVEHFIAKCESKLKLPALYLVDSILRRSKSIFGDTDPYGPRFSRNLLTTFAKIFQGCLPEDKVSVNKVVDLWQKDNIFLDETIQALRDIFESEESKVFDLNNTENEAVEENGEIEQEDFAMDQIQSSKSRAKFAALSLESLADSLDHDEDYAPLPSHLRQIASLVDSIKIPHTSENVAIKENIGEAMVEMKQEITDNNHEFDSRSKPSIPNQSKIKAINPNQINWTAPTSDRDDDDSYNQRASTFNQRVEKATTYKASSTETFREANNKRSYEEYNSEEDNYGNETQARHSSQAMPFRGQYSPGPSREHFSDEKPNLRGNRIQSNTEYCLRLPDNSEEARFQKRFRGNSDEQFRRSSSPSPAGSPNEDTPNHEELVAFPKVREDHLTICSTTLWIGSLPTWVAQEEVRNAFLKYGPITQLYMKRGANCAYIYFKYREDAVKAYKQLRRSCWMWDTFIKYNWAPGHGLKDRRYKEFWMRSIGCTFIPYGQLDRNLRAIEALEEGGEIHKESIPDWLQGLNISKGNSNSIITNQVPRFEPERQPHVMQQNVPAMSNPLQQMWNQMMNAGPSAFQQFLPAMFAQMGQSQSQPFGMPMSAMRMPYMQQPQPRYTAP